MGSILNFCPFLEIAAMFLKLMLKSYGATYWHDSLYYLLYRSSPVLNPRVMEYPLNSIDVTKACTLNGFNLRI